MSKSCSFIKIDVEFAGEGIEKRSDYLPGDKIVRVSRPYLEYPVFD
jgi:hypothetical protein